MALMIPRHLKFEVVNKSHLIVKIQRLTWSAIGILYSVIDICNESKHDRVIMMIMIMMMLQLHTDEGDDEHMIKFRIPSRNRQGVSLSFLEVFSGIALSFGAERQGGSMRARSCDFFLVSAHMHGSSIPPAATEPHECHSHNLYVQQRRTGLFLYTWPVNCISLQRSELFLINFTQCSAYEGLRIRCH
jgi:hypothetical protein